MLLGAVGLSRIGVTLDALHTQKTRSPDRTQGNGRNTAANWSIVRNFLITLARRLGSSSLQRQSDS